LTGEAVRWKADSVIWRNRACQFLIMVRAKPLSARAMSGTCLPVLPPGTEGQTRERSVSTTQGRQKSHFPWTAIRSTLLAATSRPAWRQYSGSKQSSQRDGRRHGSLVALQFMALLLDTALEFSVARASHRVRPVADEPCRDCGE
jgi:hypothetical protein